MIINNVDAMINNNEDPRAANNSNAASIPDSLPPVPQPPPIVADFGMTPGYEEKLKMENQYQDHLSSDDEVVDNNDGTRQAL